MVERKSINTLFFSYDGMTDPLGQSQVLPYIERLTKQGYQVTLISFEKDERKARRPFIEQLTKKAGIDWHPIRYTKGLPVLGAMWNVRKLRKLALQLHQEKNFKLVHCRSLLPAIVALELKQKYGVKFLFDMRGFWADERVDGKVWNLSNPLFKSVYKYFKHKEKEALQQADHVISLTHNGKKVIEEWGYGKAPISVIPCCVDLALFHATEEHPQQQRTNELVIGYLGAIGTWYMLPEMMDFFQRLLLKYPNACFHFITREDPEVIYREAAQRNIPKQHFKVEAANREDIPQKLLTWDFSIF
ncbi:MAG: glycosyltransferase [Flammeovirgaceae bacterium]